MSCRSWFLTYFTVSASSAQSQTQPQQARKPAETSTMKMDDVSKWTQKQWKVAKANRFREDAANPDLKNSPLHSSNKPEPILSYNHKETASFFDLKDF
jgi:hypothetical protein